MLSVPVSSSSDCRTISWSGELPSDWFGVGVVARAWTIDELVKIQVESCTTTVFVFAVPAFGVHRFLTPHRIMAMPNRSIAMD